MPTLFEKKCYREGSQLSGCNFLFECRPGYLEFLKSADFHILLMEFVLLMPKTRDAAKLF